jgi:hypothetical protein
MKSAGWQVPPVHRCWWSFDTNRDNKVFDEKMMCTDTVTGYQKLVPGIKGYSLKLDGYTTGIYRKVSDSPKLVDQLTIEGWVALQAMPWNRSAIICLETSGIKDDHK